MKLDDVQRFRIRLAYDHAAAVMRQVKLQTLDRNGCRNLKYFEDAVLRLECVLMSAEQAKAESDAKEAA